MRRNAGMTLIEVLLALSILAIALTAVMHAASQTIRQTLYLQQRTLATWVGLEILNEMQAGLRTPPEGAGTLHGESRMAEQDWSWDITAGNTPTPSIKTLQITVYHEPDEISLANLMGYLHVRRN